MMKGNSDKLIIAFLTVFSVLTVLSSCNSLKPSYKANEANWQEHTLPEKPVDNTVYLIGDVGEVVEMQEGEVHQLLHKQLNRESANSSTIFLGDQIYPAGLPADTGSDDHKIAEKKLNASLDILKGYPGKGYYISGNHDWRAGLKGIKAQEKHVEQYPGVNAKYLPDNGCPGPQAVELSSDLVLITIDSEQWLRQMEFNTDCNHISLEIMLDQTKALFNKHAGKNIIVALHHPIFSDGTHGGHFPLADHFFPLRHVVTGLYLPLPGIGSIYPLGRAAGVSVEDIPNQRHQKLKEGLLDITKRRPRVVFASGHGHNLQYFKEKGNNFIVSGSGSKTGYVKRNGDADFAHSAKGYFKLTQFEDGSAWIEAVEPQGEEHEKQVVFRKKLLDPFPADEFMDIPEDSTVTVVPGPIYEANGFQRLMLGDDYRDIWLAPIEVPVVDLGEKKGGLKLVEKGGGQQTMSLKVRGAKGNHYTFRSIDKDPSKALPEQMRNTVAADIVQDQISASNPYGAFSVQYMQEAAGIYHTNPELVYIPDDPALGRFREMFGGMLAMFEEDVDESWENTGKFGETENAVGTETMLEDLEDDSDNRIDQKAFLRVRLFDMLVGDWDRHGGQWRWAEFEDIPGYDILFRPVPEDRDNVFFKGDGILPWLGARKWALRKFKHFDEEIRDIRGLNYNGRHLDKRALSELTLKDWRAIADTLQQSLTPEIMKNALKKGFPDTAYNLVGEEILEDLIARKQKLKTYAEQYYKVLAQEVDIWGSNNSEFFEVERLNADSTQVTMYNSNDEGEKERLLYQRVFKTSETDEIRLYALGDRDYIHVTGRVKDGITIRVVGGEGKDVMVDRSKVSGLKKHTRYYDTETRLGGELRAVKYPKPANEVQKSSETALLIKNDPDVHEIDRQSFEFNDVITPIVNIGFNEDDGFFLGAGAQFKTHGFRKEPYAAKHRIEGTYAFEIDGYNFFYNGDFNQVLGDLDLDVDLQAFAPNFETNFYGFGNETDLGNEGEDFHRVTFDQYIGRAKLVSDLGEKTEFSIGPEYQYVDVEKDEERYVSEPEAGFTEEDFQPRQFAGLNAGFKFSTLKKGNVIPKSGFYWEAWGKSLMGLDGDSEDFSQFGSDIRAYFTYEPLETTLALRAGAATNTGDFEFYHAKTLGGEDKRREQGNLRGFRRDRFTGRSNFYQNTELRIKLFNFRTYLFPGEFGIMGLNDVGRVWADNENSEVWHHGYGGGIWLVPFKRVVLTGTYSISEEAELININAGFRF